MPYVSWQTVVLGDPLCAPFRTTNLTPAEIDSAIDPETDLPKLFSARRRALLAIYGVKPDVARLLLKADSRLMRGDLTGGRQALEELVGIDPTLNGANLVLAGIYEQSKDYARAAERYRAILATRPDDVRALNNLAYLLAVNQNSPGEALPLAEKAYKMAAGKELIQDFAFALVARRGTPAEALPFNERAFNVSTSHAQIADTFGWTQHLVGQNAAADPLLAEAVAGDPQNGVIQLHVAVVKAALGLNEAAGAALKRSLELDPRLEADPEVTRVREKLKTP
jgi:Tfp pilus assembly protein PilF